MKYFKTQVVKATIRNRKNRFFNSHNGSFVFIGAILLLFIYCTGCKTEIGPFPNEPSITYKGLTKLIGPNGKDSVIQITFDFKDGDGDIGLGVFDTMPPFNFGSDYFYNLIVNVEQQVNGNFEPILRALTNDPVNFDTRIPVITPQGNNKAIDGEFTLKVDVNMNAVTQPDSIKFNLFIYDRALNKSNVIETPVVFIDL